MLVEGLTFAAGLVILLAAGEILVRGAVGLAFRFGLSPLLIGLTVVAFGTSAPELLVSVDAALEGAPGIALGNIVGSNIANILLILGCTAVLAPIRAYPPGAGRSYLQMLCGTLLFIALSYRGPVAWPQALALLAGLMFVLVDSFRAASRDPAADQCPDGSPRPLRNVIGALVLGLLGLPIGASLIVAGATGLARYFGIGEEVIGLTIVAVGTSLPELAASAMAALRGHPAVAIGNVIGSNLFNVLGIGGVAGLFGPIAVPERIVTVDNWVMLGATLVLAPFVLGRRAIGRLWAGGLLALYAGFIGLVAV